MRSLKEDENPQVIIMTHYALTRGYELLAHEDFRAFSRVWVETELEADFPEHMKSCVNCESGPIAAYLKQFQALDLMELAFKL